VNEEDLSDKPSFVRRSDRTRLDRIDRWRLAIARSLMGVDRGIASIIQAQEARDPGLVNTFVLFVSDNGRMLGEHRLIGKSVAYEEAIRVPLLVRWPALAPGIAGRLVGNIDIAATIADVAGIGFAAPDSRSMLGPPRQLYVLEGVGGNKAYCGIRTEQRKYVRYASGEAEYYNLRRDPYELENRPDAPAARELRRIARSLCAHSLPPDWPSDVPY
jgi:arylsulfatase A-like enzyme